MNDKDLLNQIINKSIEEAFRDEELLRRMMKNQLHHEMEENIKECIKLAFIKRHVEITDTFLKVLDQNKDEFHQHLSEKFYNSFREY